MAFFIVNCQLLISFKEALHIFSILSKHLLYLKLMVLSQIKVTIHDYIHIIFITLITPSNHSYFEMNPQSQLLFIFLMKLCSFFFIISFMHINMKPCNYLIPNHFNFIYMHHIMIFYQKRVFMTLCPTLYHVIYPLIKIRIILSQHRVKPITFDWYEQPSVFIVPMSAYPVHLSPEPKYQLPLGESLQTCCVHIPNKQTETQHKIGNNIRTQ